MKKLPGALQVGPLCFVITEDVTAFSQAVLENDGRLYGRVTYSTGQIVLDPEQMAGHKQLALLHEVLHACWHLTDNGHDGDEEVIRRLAAPLLDVLQRNPALVAYLTDRQEAK